MTTTDTAISRNKVVVRIEQQIRLWNDDTVTMACADMLADIKQLPPIDTEYAGKHISEHVADLQSQLEQLQQTGLHNAQLVDRIRAWSKCEDGYPLDEHINNITAQLEQLRAELARTKQHRDDLIEELDHERKISNKPPSLRLGIR